MAYHQQQHIKEGVAISMAGEENKSIERRQSWRHGGEEK